MEKTIKTGDKIRIKENLMDELVRCGFNKEEMKLFVKRFKGKNAEAYDVYQGEDSNGNPQMFVTVDLCCEIPLAACEAL